jgi:hypothetical protein
MILKIKKFGVIAIVYTIYGIIGLPSHLFVKDYIYPVFILVAIAYGAGFDYFLSRMYYTKLGFIIGFPIFVVTLNLFLSIINSRAITDDLIKILVSITLGFVGIVIGYVAYYLFEFKKNNGREV